ncbi:MAG TPA: OmpA family protein [Afifellaceae bacterium]|nr:OmpA family protein [Afifellaceae bacterium]
MKRTKLVLALAAAGLALGSTNAVADADQPWHVTGQIGGVKLDSDRNTRDDDVWWSVGFGRFFGNNISLDLEYDEFSGTYRDYNVVVPGATFDQWGLSNIGVMGRYHFGDGNLRPYVAAGLGYLSHRNVGDEGEGISKSLGVGLQGKIAEHWSARAQVLWRKDRDAGSIPAHSGYNDLIYSIGMSFDFGGQPPPPAPAAAEPPPPPPPPPNPDLDGDGVPNARDKCPNTRPGAVVDLDGCEVEAVIELEGVNFDFDKATIRPEGKAILNGAAALLQQHERVVVEVAGHTDSIGTDAYNQGLSERRANAVKDYLTSKGITATRLTARGDGESRPVASNDTDAGRAENRRVELIVLDR